MKQHGVGVSVDIPQTGFRQDGPFGYWPCAILFAVVFAASLLGIWTRPAGFLASIWPANALMLGMLLRVPGAARWGGWLAGATAFMAADLLTGASLFKASILNVANLASVAVAYRVLYRLPKDIIRLRQPLSMIYIVLAAALGGAVAGVIGGMANPLLFGGSVLDGFTFWWVSEIVNYVAILSIFLSAPSFRTLSRVMEVRTWSYRRYDMLPALTILGSCVLALVIGGPGAIAFPVLALLWCGLVYPVFITAILTWLCSLFALMFISREHFPNDAEHMNLIALFSIRLGITVIAIAPIMLSIVIRSRNELLAQLRYSTTHDSLTGVGSRAAFREEAEHILREADHPHAIMMIDLDHFKAINDTHGHAVGDKVLCEVAKRITVCLRPDDRLGRLGGEEFAVILKICQPQIAQEIAERIRTTIAGQPVIISDFLSIPVTTSIGLTFTGMPAARCLDTLLSEADAALYQGKQNGRNRVEFAVKRE